MFSWWGVLVYLWGVLCWWAHGCELTIQCHHLTEYDTELSTEPGCSSELGFARFLHFVQCLLLRKERWTKYRNFILKCNVPLSEPFELMIIDLRLIKGRGLLSSWATVSFLWRTVLLGVLQLGREKSQKDYWSLWLFLHFVLWFTSPVDVFSRALCILNCLLYTSICTNKYRKFVLNYSDMFRC